MLSPPRPRMRQPVQETFDTWQKDYANQILKQQNQEHLVLKIFHLTFSIKDLVSLTELVAQENKPVYELHFSENGTDFCDGEFIFKQVCEHFTELRVLRIMSNFITCVPPIHGLHHLHSLSLNRNQIKELPDAFFESISTIHHLDLSNNQLDRAPLHLLTELRSLNISHNNLTSFYHDCKNFEELSRHWELVNASNNKISEIIDMSCLFTASLTNTTISSAMHPLKELHMKSNCIRELPAIFYENVPDAPPTPLTPPVDSPSKVFSVKPSVFKVVKAQPAKSPRSLLRRIDFSYNLISQFPSLSVLKRLARVGVQAFDIRFNLFCQVPDFGDVVDDSGSTSVGGDLSTNTVRYSHILLGIAQTIPDLVVENLYIGGADCAKNTTLLLKLGIKYILNASVMQTDAHFPELFTEVRVLNANDSNDQDMSKFFEDCNLFIDNARKDGGVLVHCIAGQSRSVTIVIAYLMYSQGLSFKDAFATVKKVREVSQPNMNFTIQLTEYEEALKKLNG